MSWFYQPLLPASAVPSVLATAYWVGGAGTWDASDPTNWAETSGGTGGAGYPDATSNVIFDANSGTGTVTINGGVCNDLTLTSTVSAVTLAPTTSGLSIYGSVSIAGTGATISGSAAITFAATTSETITTGGETFDCPVTFNGVGGTWVLQDNMTIGATRTTTLTNGTLNLNGKTLSTGIFDSNNSNTRTITSSTAATLILTYTSTANILSMYSTTNFTGSNNITVDVTGNDSGVTKTITVGDGFGVTVSQSSAFNYIIGGNGTTIRLFDANFTCINLTITNTTCTIQGTPWIYGNLTILGTSPTCATFTRFKSTSGTKTITTNGNIKSSGTIVFDGVGGTWQLVDNFTGSSSATLDIILTNGTLDLNGKTLTASTFSSSNSNTRTLTSATATTLTITATTGTIVDITTSTNFTGSGNISIVATAASSSSKTIVLNQASEGNAFNLTASTSTTTLSISGNVNNLTIPSGSAVILLGAALNVYGNLSIGTGNVFSGSNVFTLTFASTSGTKTITTNSVNINTPVTFSGVGGTWQLIDNMTVGSTKTTTLANGTIDINGKILSTGIFSSSNSNTRNITFGTAGGKVLCTSSSTTLLDFANSTSLTLTGTPIFQLSSSGTINIGGTAQGYWTEANTLDVSDNNPSTTAGIFINGIQKIIQGHIKSFTTSSNGNNISIPLSTSLYVYGSWSQSGISASLGVGPHGTLIFAATSGTKTINTSGINYSGFTVNFNGAGGTWQFSANGTFGNTTLTNGTVDLNGKSVTVNSFTTAAGTKNITFNAGTLAVSTGTTTAFNNAAPTNFTTTAGTGTGIISMTSSSAKTFVGGGSTYNCTLRNAGAGALTISGNNTFTTINNSVQPTTFTFTSGSTQTVTNFSVSGTAGNLVTINSTTSGSPATLSKSSGTVSVSYCSIKDSTVTGGATWQAYTSNGNVDNTGNLGWLFAAALAGYIKVYMGSGPGWVYKPTKVWNGTQWVIKPVKWYDTATTSWKITTGA